MRDYIKRIALFLALSAIVILCTSKVFASTIDSSNISINIVSNGVCNINEVLDITAIDEQSAYDWYDAPYPSVHLIRGDDIENLSINKYSLSDYCNEWRL